MKFTHFSVQFYCTFNEYDKKWFKFTVSFVKKKLFNLKSFFQFSTALYTS